MPQPTRPRVLASRSDTTSLPPVQPGQVRVSNTLTSQNHRVHHARRHQSTLRTAPVIQHHRAAPRQAQPNNSMAYAWREWPCLRVHVASHRPSWTTEKLFVVFSQYGCIGRIHIQRDNAAVILFVPPPNEPFWLDTIRFDGEPVSARVTLLPDQRSIVRNPFNPRIMHPEFLNISAKELAFGVMVHDTTMMQMLTLRSKHRNDVVMQVNTRRRDFDIRFQFPPLAENTTALGRFRVPFRTLTHVQCINMGDHHAVIFTLASPPEFFRQLDGGSISFDSSPWNEWSSWTRQTGLVDPRFASDMQKAPLRTRTEHAVIDYGRWLTYRFIVPKSNQFTDMLKVLRDFNVTVQHLRAADYTFLARQDAQVWKHLELSSKREIAARHAGMSEMESGIKHLPFPVLWQLMVCISRGFLNEYNMGQDFLQKLDAIGAVTAQGLLERVADCKLKFHDPMKVFTDVKMSHKSKRIPPYCSLLYACDITPTTVLFSSPVVEISNRVIRKNSEYQDRFLRVRFTEENGGRIHSQKDSTNEELFIRIRRFLSNGLILGDRHYEFLAFGNSQFREHGLCAFASIRGLAEIPDMTAEEIRAQLGCLQHIRVPAKWCARLGQNFSTTRAFPTSVIVKSRLADVERNGFTFTDGVGKMSRFVAAMIGLEFGRPMDDPPSVVQFRLGGCKGILAISPELGSREICIRESQYKFDSPNTGLEIIRVSQFMSATFNRQLIVLLSSNGVRDEVFTQMQRSMLTDLELAMTDEDTALRLLTKFIDFNHTTLAMARMILDGFMEAGDPFVVSLLRLWRSWLIKNLKDKARIFIEKGACLFGTVDEFSVLKGHDNKGAAPPGSTREAVIASLPQVFVQVDAERNGRYHVLTDVCMIARNPSLHPGDVRIVRAVDRPELRHLKDVLVLPQTGDRDLGSMCSGGDLDGDDYLVIWDQTLLPPMDQWNQAPMDFAPHPPQPLDRPVTVDDVGDFFIQYIKNDQLPSIALAHLCWADKASDGVKDPRCLRLAKLHSHAVDYPKSGQPAQMTRDLRPDTWPHFMESLYRKPEQIYHSKAVLGQLFDMIERIDFSPALERPFDLRILNAFQVPEGFSQKARKIKNEYDTSMLRIMAQLAIATEFEVFSTFVIEHNRQKKDYTLSEELGAILQMHKNRFREMCADAAGGRTYDKIGPFIVAMYKVTQEEVAQANTRVLLASLQDTRRDYQQPLITFPWIFGAELGKIATGQYRGDEIISVIMTEQFKKANARRKRPVAKYGGLEALIELPEMDTVAANVTSDPGQETKNLEQFDDERLDTSSGDIGLTQSITGNSLASKSLLPDGCAGDTVVLPPLPLLASHVQVGLVPTSRSESPFSSDVSEFTARASTPPSSHGEQEDCGRLESMSLDGDEDVYVEDEDNTIVESGIVDRMAALRNI